MNYFKPYSGPWTKEEAAHLLRRAGFGGRPEEIQSLADMSIDEAVSSVLDYPSVDQPYEERINTIRRRGNYLGVLFTNDLKDLQSWWIYRMQYATFPMQEQLTLFWHDHFVSDWPTVRGEIPQQVNNGNDGSLVNQQCNRGTLGEDKQRREKITVRILQEQNHLFREEGFKAFGDLLLKVTRNPAMLIYLDNHLNTKTRPQENYARELMELFSMGVGNYSEEDVREVARALTGEGLNRRCDQDFPFSHRFIRGLHDQGEKTVFGSTFNDWRISGEDTETVINLVLERVSKSGITPAHDRLPATAVYMTWKLLNWFVGEEIPIDHPAVEELAEPFYEHQPNGYRYDVRELLRTVLTSDFFYSDEFRWKMYKHPADYIVMALRNLDVEEISYHDGAAMMMREMGMSLFEPPNVAGWNHGKSWINSGNILGRFNYADHFSTRRIISNRYCDDLIANGFIENEEDFDGMIEYHRERLLQTSLLDQEYSILRNFLRRIVSGRDIYYRRIRGLVYLMLTMPKYQLK